MNPKFLHVRMDKISGDIYLVEERPRKPLRRLKNLTSDIYFVLAADILVEENTKSASREIRFSDGKGIKITVEEIEDDGSAVTGSD